jgi:hypothetical protein
LRKGFVVRVSIYVFMAAILLAALTYLRFYLGPQLAREGLKQVLGASLGEHVTVERTMIQWLGLPGIEYRGLKVRHSEEQTEWLGIDRVILRPSLKSFFSGSLRWRWLGIDRPVIRVSGREGGFSLAFLGPILSRLDRLRIRRGEIKWPGREVEDLYVSSSPGSAGGSLQFTIKGVLRIEGALPGRFSARGLARGLYQSKDASGPVVSAEINAEGINALWFGDYVGSPLPPQLLEARLGLSASFDGELRGAFHSSGIMSLTGPSLGSGIEELGVDFAADWDGRALRFQRIRLKEPFIPMEGKGRIHWKNRTVPWISFEVSCPWVSIRPEETPLPFLPERIHRFLEEVEQGEVTLSSVGYRGPLKELAIPETEESFSRWNGTIRFRDVHVPYNGERIRLKTGSVRLEKNTILAEDVVFALDNAEAEISRLALRQPFGDRSLNLSLQGELDLAAIPKWVSMGLVPGALSEPLSHVQLVSGKGRVDLEFEDPPGLESQAVFHGVLVLQDAALRTRHLPGTFRSLNGTVDISPGNLAVRELQGRWRQTSVSAKGAIKYLSNGRSEIDFSMKGHLNLGDLAEISSWEGLSSGTGRVFREIGAPTGEGDYVLKIKGILGVPQGIDIVGDLSVQNGSSLLWHAYPVRAVKGRIRVSQDGLTLSSLEGTWKNSTVGLDGSITGSGKDAVRDLIFSATFDIRDIAEEPFDRGLPSIWKRYLKPYDFQQGRSTLKVAYRSRDGRDTVDGKVLFEGASVRYEPEFPPLGDITGRVSFSEKGLETMDEGQSESLPNRFNPVPSCPGRSGRLGRGFAMAVEQRNPSRQWRAVPPADQHSRRSQPVPRDFLSQR